MSTQMVVGSAQACWRCLTRRETEVLKLVALGKTNAEIGGLLCISRHTVSCHIARILAKLEVPNRTSAARWLVEGVGPPNLPGPAAR